MAQDIRQVTGQSDSLIEKRRGFHPFATMAEGLRMRRARRNTLDAVDAAARFGERESLDSAFATYAALPAAHKERVLLDLQRSLKLISYCPFEDAQKTARLSAIADFFSKAATLLPVDAEGERVTAPYKDAIRMLRDIVEREEFRNGSSSSHSDAILACSQALWELEYGNFGFWESRVRDPATRDYVITKLLEMPEAEDVTESGWYLLRNHLDEIGPAIAASASAKRDEFFASMFMDGDMKVAASAMRAAVCLESTPGELYGIAGELSQVPGMEGIAQSFTMIGRFKEQLSGVGEDRLLAAKHLAVYYADGMKNLQGLLEKTSREITAGVLEAEPHSQDHLKGLEVLVHMAAVGITPYSPDELGKMLGPYTGTRAAVAIYYNLTQNIMGFSPRGDLKAAASELEAARVNACFGDLSYVDDRQFDAAHELVLLYSTGRIYLVENGMIPKLAQEMVEIILEPAGESAESKDAQVGKANRVLDHMRQVGIDIQINHEPAISAEQGSGAIGGEAAE